ncbi:hypothetical protein M5G25_11210 [Pseudomonas sp. TNT2022 ID357]|uniref:Histone deacetylase domain-containing protein n=1 Tax=Pseudomonas idahonensis TaxID=2942628 RepID=A0ABT5Q3U1_9PSED|nr:hypothetical protein [Pseudomonas idahonensis]MDD1148861.1 hypothetical protein [Pseudomonas idahonensis]
MDIFWHDDVLLHDAGAGVFEAPPSSLLWEQMQHPESNPRLLSMRAVLQQGPVSGDLRWHSGRHASAVEVLRFHEARYLDELIEANQEGRRFSPTTLMSAGSLIGMLAAAGTSVAAGQSALNSGRPAMALVRPPGHHAAPAMADGYCFLNNAAIAARALQASGIDRVAILDWDVHHGNGTQEGFYEDPTVFTISMHMDHGAWGESHPQTGGVDECGRGAGLSFNLNLPLPMGSGDLLYERVLVELVVPQLRRFAPQMLIVANGLDASQFDPNGRQLLTMQGFNRLARYARALADELCEGRLLVVQEGGYNPAYSAFCLHAATEGFLDRPSSLPDPLAYMPESVERTARDFLDLKARLEEVGWSFGEGSRRTLSELCIS